MKTKTNMNDSVKVKLTDKAKDFWKEQVNIRGIKGTEYELTDEVIEKRKDKDGYHSFQIHDLMNTFGPLAIIGFESPFIGNEILIEKTEE